MLIAGIVGGIDKAQTADLIYSIISLAGVRISVIDSGSIVELDKNKFKAYIEELKKSETYILLIKIDVQDIEKDFFDNLHFDIMLYTDKADDLYSTDDERYAMLMRKVFSMVDERGTLIVNADDVDGIAFLKGMKYYTVTYGFNRKSSVTTSSMGDNVFKDGFIYCLQRSITAKNGLVFEPQEYKLDFGHRKYDGRIILAAVTFVLVCGIDVFK
ncbi:MAG TPA: glutamate ligase [Clostridiaceae bacterium]|nr:glutamate ligase [Clostridiaceae bacterium]